VTWAELLPDEFTTRLEAHPIAYLPFGLVEPHGHVAAFGLDTIKAEWLCREAASRFGGIVAPTQGWHIHETGYHAPWLAQVVGNENPRLGGLPPHVVLHALVFQLRAIANAGFALAVLLTGHCGGNEADLRLVADAFAHRFHWKVLVLRDLDLVEGRFGGDHAGKFELSQLMAIRPDLVDLRLLERQHEAGAGGRLALGDDAREANVEYGRQIMDASLERFGQLLEPYTRLSPRREPRITLADAESLWQELRSNSATWKTLRFFDDGDSLPDDSQWLEAAHWRP
jgi:creatinine amidohydrolase